MIMTTKIGMPKCAKKYKQIDSFLVYIYVYVIYIGLNTYTF